MPRRESLPGSPALEAAERHRRITAAVDMAATGVAAELAAAITRRLELDTIPPGHESSDGLPENEAELERADDKLLESMAQAAGMVSVCELAAALVREKVDHA